MARKTYDDDDGRTIVNMNVEGMPGYGPRRGLFSRRKENPRPRIDENGMEIPDGQDTVVAEPEPEPLSKKEMRSAIFSATLAGLVVALVMSAGIILFTLFCTNIWFD